MVDMFSKQKRSEIMSRIRSKNTSIEVLVFKFLHANRIYFQKHYDKVPGKPDVALPRKKKAIFIDSDFWHGYRFKEFKDRMPQKYWIPKIEKNIRRDRKNRLMLKRNGWKILRVWEHELMKKKDKTLNNILKFIKN